MDKRVVSCVAAGLALTVFAGVAFCQGKTPAPPVTDATATESMKAWSKHYVPSLRLSDEAKVGKYSIVGDFGFTQNAVFLAGDKKAWDFTKYEKVRFWAKADRANDNLLVMLMTQGFKHRRDAVVALTTEWKRYELPISFKTFCKNVQGKAEFERVRAVAFYNNGGAATRIWIDGLEFVPLAPGTISPVAKVPPRSARPAPSQSLKAETFDRSMKAMADWTFLGNCTQAQAVGLDAAKSCLAIEGSGFAESPRIAVTPDAAYRVSGYGKTEDDWQNNSCIKVKWFDKNMKPVWWEFVRRDSFTKEWKKYEKVVIAPRDAAYGSVICHAQATWGKSSFFTDIRFAGVKASPLLWDIHFDHLDNGWINDRSVYGNDGKAYCLSLDDFMVTQSGGAINFNNRKAKVRFFHSRSFSPAAHGECVIVLQFFLEEPVPPRDEAPENAVFNILGARWNTSIAYHKAGEKGALKVSFYAYQPGGSATHPAVSFAIEPWKWYRLTLVVNNHEGKIEGRLLKDGKEVSKAAARISGGELRDPPFLYVGALDYPGGGNTPYPWGMWGKLDYIKVYDSVAAYEADLKNIVYGGFGER